MISVIKNYIDNVFKTLPQTSEVLKAKEDLLHNMEDKFLQLIEEGKSEAEAFSITVSEFGNIEDILEDLDINAKPKYEFKADSTNNSYTKSENYYRNFEQTNDKPHHVNSSKKFGISLIIFALVAAYLMLFNDDFDIFFEGWWTLFIIVPSVVGIVTGPSRFTSFIGLIIGAALFFGVVYNFDWVWPLGILIAIGLYGAKLLFTKSEPFKKLSDVDEHVVAIFGGSDVDLSNVEFTSDKYIKCTAIFGGIDIKVPKDVNVVAQGVAIFGGVGNEARRSNTRYTLYVEYTCGFGGIDIN